LLLNIEGKKIKKLLYFADNNKLEVIWSIIPAIVLAGLILYGLYAWTNIMFVDKNRQDPIVIEFMHNNLNGKQDMQGKIMC
jgi:cytochrome c oxidase subunit 2